jgi:hypothetical protein
MECVLLPFMAVKFCASRFNFCIQIGVCVYFATVMWMLYPKDEATATLGTWRLQTLEWSITSQKTWIFKESIHLLLQAVSVCKISAFHKGGMVLLDGSVLCLKSQSCVELGPILNTEHEDSKFLQNAGTSIPDWKVVSTFLRKLFTVDRYKRSETKQLKFSQKMKYEYVLLQFQCYWCGVSEVVLGGDIRMV